MENCRENMIVLREGLEKTGRFNIVSKDEGVPLVAFSLKDNSSHTEFEVSDMLRRLAVLTKISNILSYLELG